MQDLGDAAPQLAGRGGADAAAHHLAEQRMAEAGVDLAVVGDDPDQAAHLGGVDGVLPGQFGERVDVQRLAQREQFQRVQYLLAGMRQAFVEQFDQPGRDDGGPAELPHPVHLGQGPGVHGAFDHVAQEQRVAAGGLPHHIGAEAFQRSAQHGLDERDALLFGERAELEALEVTVLPQRRHGVGDRFTAAHGGHHVAGTLDGDLVQQGRRQLVQQVRVVDADDGVAVGHKRFPCRTDEGDRVTRP